MYATNDLLVSFVSSVALGVMTSNFKVASLNTVVTIKKNSSIKMMSGKEAVETFGFGLLLFCVKVDII